MSSNNARRTRGKRISYAEVDSDVDISEDEKKVDEVDQGGGKRRKKSVATLDEDSDGVVYSAKTASSSTTKKDTKPKKEKKPKYNSKLLLEIPFDIFVMMFTHLEFEDLISLAKVNKSLRKLLLSRAARPIWSAMRRKDEYPLPEGMSEIRFATLLKGESCEACGARSYIERSIFLEYVLCKECRSERTITSYQIKDDYENLHPQTLSCVRFDQGWSTESTLKINRKAWFLPEEFAQVNSELLEAEEDDEIDQIAAQSKPRKSTSRRRSTQQGPETSEERSEVVSRVETYVNEKSQWVAKHQKSSSNIVEIAARRRQEAFSEIRAGKRALWEKYSDELEQAGWSEDDIDDCQWAFRYARRQPPKVSPSSDIEQWNAFLGRVQQPQPTNPLNYSSVRDALKPFYTSLKSTEASHRYYLFPTESEFLEFATVQSYMKDEKAKPFNKSLWLKLLPSILSDLDRYCGDRRVEAIRSILAAQQRISVSKISTSATKYTLSQYPDSFFRLATSLFAPRAFDEPPKSYFDIGETEQDWGWNGKGTFSHRGESRLTLTIQSIIEAAGLDKSTATVNDLDSLGQRLTWDNDPNPNRRDTLRTWKDLVYHVRLRGSNKTKYKDGSATVQVSYFPQVDFDGSTYLDQEGDGPGEEINSDDDEAQKVDREDEANSEDEDSSEGEEE